MAKALGRAPAASERAYLSLLDRRLAALARASIGDPVSAAGLGATVKDRACARRFLRPREGTWHDGDENLVRGLVEGWSDASVGAPARRAERLLAAADRLAGIGAPPPTLWFFLWEMESVLANLGGGSSER